jgi:hypothetical protein
VDRGRDRAAVAGERDGGLALVVGGLAAARPPSARDAVHVDRGGRRARRPVVRAAFFLVRACQECERLRVVWYNRPLDSRRNSRWKSRKKKNTRHRVSLARYPRLLSFTPTTPPAPEEGMFGHPPLKLHSRRVSAATAASQHHAASSPSGRRLPVRGATWRAWSSRTTHAHATRHTANFHTRCRRTRRDGPCERHCSLPPCSRRLGPARRSVRRAPPAAVLATSFLARRSMRRRAPPAAVLTTYFPARGGGRYDRSPTAASACCSSRAERISSAATRRGAR